ncbi:hypothetical protein M0R45_000950 [Rubus argutus]|uniref:Uncharacterized protein n=1 Tax=Rubus argutus TaxID=59490 RepID=A0AAW1VNL5_RUBAR
MLRFSFKIFNTGYPFEVSRLGFEDCIRVGSDWSFHEGGEDYSDNSPISSTDELAVQYQYKPVEDHTGRGIVDLKEGRIANPRPPELALVEDPARVLHAIRYVQIPPRSYIFQSLKRHAVRPGIRLRNKVFWGVALLLSTLFNPSDVVVDCA